MAVTRTNIWARFVREAWSVKAVAEKLKVSEEYAAGEMARVRRGVMQAIIAETVAHDLRSNWNPAAAVGLTFGQRV